MARRFIPPDERALYLNELEQLEQSLGALRQRLRAAHRAVQADKWIHLAHVRAVQSLNTTLLALVEVWQPEYQNKPTLHQSL